MSFISFLFIFVAYSQYCPTTNKLSKSQTIKCFIYYHFINHNSQSNTLAKTIYKSQLASYFLNSDSPTYQLPKKKKKKNSEIDRDSQAPNTITYSNSIHSHLLQKKKKKRKEKKKKKDNNNDNNTISQSQIHNTNIISMLC